MSGGPSFDSLFIVIALTWLADVVEEWLPGWTLYPLGFIWIVALLVLGCVEYLIRFVVTPKKYWMRNK
jgi:hypothetical protein